MTARSFNSGARRPAGQPPATFARADLDALVARYAPIGRRVRRQRNTRRLMAAVLVPVLGLAGFQAWEAGGARLRTILDAPAISSEATDSAARMDQALEEFRKKFPKDNLFKS